MWLFENRSAVYISINEQRKRRKDTFADRQANLC